MTDPTPGDPTKQSRATMSAEGLLPEERDAAATEAGSTRAAGAGVGDEQLADQVAAQTDSSAPNAQVAGTTKGPND